MSVSLLWRHRTRNVSFFLSLRASVEEVEGDVCELESKLDKVSTTHGKHCMIVHAVRWESDCLCANLVKSWRFIWGLKEQEVVTNSELLACRKNCNYIFFLNSVLNYTKTNSARAHESVCPIPAQGIFTGVRRRLGSGFIFPGLAVLQKPVLLLHPPPWLHSSLTSPLSLKRKDGVSP